MERAAKGFLLLSVFISLTWSSPKKAFHFVPDKMDFPSARNHCSEHLVDMASMVDAADLDLLMKNLAGVKDDYVFVGLKREWHWITLSTEDQTEAEIKFDRFEIGEPRDQNRCGRIRASGEWTTKTCGKNSTFICYDEKNPDRFVLGNGSLSWPNSLKYCTTHHTNLARIQTEEENERVVSLINGTDAWIGLNRREWTWTDLTYFSKFLSWSASLGGSNCAVLDITGQKPTLRRALCDDKFPFVCYDFGEKKDTVRMTMKSDVDLSDPAVADSVMKMVQQKLEEQGFPQNVSLTWSKRPQKVIETSENQTSQESCSAQRDL